jgi:hypothetical protein
MRNSTERRGTESANKYRACDIRIPHSAFRIPHFYNNVANKGLLLMVGTAKGLFVLRGNNGKWSIDGPHFAGLAVYSALFEQRVGRNEMWAGPVSWDFGAELCKSTDIRKTWDQPENRRIKMPRTTKKFLVWCHSCVSWFGFSGCP